MICYKDITFCMRDCGNKKCKRNRIHLKDIPKEFDWMPIAFSEFNSCSKYKEKK